MNAFLKRTTHLTLFVGGLLLVVLLRIGWLQVVRGAEYREQASRQQAVSEKFEAHRGEILAHEKDALVPVATTKEGWLMHINPKLIEDPVKLYEDLSRIASTTMPRDEFIERASKSDDPYEIIEHRISPSVKRAIESAKLTGIAFSPERWRFYPAADFASQVIGFVGADGTGQYGLERFYNEDLFGRDGVFVGEKTSSGKLLWFGNASLTPAEHGASLVATLDTGVQTNLESVLKDLQTQYHASSAGGIIMNPKTGRIIAMASVPSFDPNIYSGVEDIAVFKNPLVEDLFEMGSVVKPLTLAAALDAEAVTLKTTYKDTGTRTIDGRTIANFDGKARGVVPIQEILSQSLNIGTVFVMEQLGKDRFRDYMYKFGLSEKTGIDVPGEATGKLNNLDSSRLIEFATASFGQGISMTGVELVRALSSIANGGFLVDPYLIEEVRDEQGSKVEKKRSEPRRVLKEETSKMVTRMLVEVVDLKLANGKGKIPGYSVAAKTGTAQIASKNSRGYSGEFMHTFFGYGPAYDPQFLVFLYIERPQGIRYASESLTQPFRATMKHLFSYFEIIPDRPHELEAKTP
ncbi:MAG: penicillin-binding protein 2 [Candidatus Ryanbacteria bacterium]|nr:penicillin-binding protein 2 [Candidatus Ryanbacteria bacterium]